MNDKLTDIEVELSFVGGVVQLAIDGRKADLMSHISEVQPEAMSEAFLADVYAMLIDKVSKGQTITNQFLLSLVDKAPEHERKTVASIVARIASNAAPASMLHEYGQHLVRLHALRRLHEALQDGIERVDRDAEPADIMSDIMQQAASVQTTSARPTSAAEAVRMLREHEVAPKLPTGMPKLDDLIDGLSFGAVSTLAARPGMGKSLMAAHIAANVARTGGAVLMFTLEMSVQAIMSRMIAAEIAQRNEMYSIQQVSARDILAGRVHPDHPDMQAAMDDVASWPIRFIERGGISLDMIRLQSELWVRECEKNNIRPSLIIIDHIGLVANPHGVRSQYEATTIKAHETMALAKNMNVPVLMVSQLSRALESRSNKIPTLADLRDAGAIEEDSEIVMFLHSERRELERLAAGSGKEAEEATRKLLEIGNRTTLVVAKNRYGPTGIIEFDMNMATCHIKC